MAYLPKNAPPIDYGNIPIKRLPPGAAFGADDLTRWALNRAQGRTGSGPADYRAVKIKCGKCGHVREALAGRSVERGDRKKCINCGSTKAKVVKSKKRDAA